MRKRLRWIVVVATLLGCAGRALALGGDLGSPSLLPGEDSLNRLFQRPGYVHGYFVNQEDRYFYAGDTAAFNAFLKQYAEIETVIVAHRLTIHDGKGVAKSPWDKGEGKPCDWMLEKGLLSWRGQRPPQSNPGANFVLEVHVWTEGKVDLTAVEIPRNVEVVGRLPSPPAGYRTDVKVAPTGAPHQYVVTCSVIEVQTDGETRVVAAPKLLVNAGTLATVEAKESDERVDSGVFCTAQVKETGGWAEVTTNVTVRVKGVEKLNTSHTVSLNLAGTAPGLE